METILDSLRSIVAHRSRGLPDEDFVLRGMWRVDYRSQPTPYERFMVYSFVMAQTIRQGCSYASSGSIELGEHTDALLGQDARVARGSCREEDIAILDAAFGVLPRKPREIYSIDGGPTEKSLARARIVVGEAMSLLRAYGGRRVANVGIIGNLIHYLQREDVDITASDFDEGLIKGGILGVPVVSGEFSPQIVAETDVALVCGETLASDTLDELVKVAKDNTTKLVLFAVTGCHFAEEYCRTFGIDAVIAEPQPQYLFQGPSTLEIYRKDNQ
ncbi:MAG: Rossmann-like domain-containing protein [Mycobacteriales bacterium]